MHVTEYELFEVPPRWQFLRLETSDGTVGWGEPIVEGRSPPVRTAVEELVENYVLGEDPTRIEDHWQVMFRSGFYRGGPVLMSAIAGIDQALWDITGKQVGASVHELLGGRVRDRMRVYAHINFYDEDSPDSDQFASTEIIAKSAEDRVADGYDAIKISQGTPGLEHVDDPVVVEATRERVAAVREAVGPEVGVAIDFHGRLSKTMAKRLVDVLDPYDLMWFEEPVLPEFSEAFPDIAARTSSPIATGERYYSRTDFRPLFEQGVVDVIQPDLSHAGGISEVRKIATMAETYDVALAPHCPLGPVALASCLQVDACSPNALIQEQDLHEDRRASAATKRRYLEDPAVLDHENGYVEIPDGAGLGIDLDESYLNEMDGADPWIPPVRRHQDGSLAQW